MIWVWVVDLVKLRKWVSGLGYWIGSIRGLGNGIVGFEFKGFWAYIIKPNNNILIITHN